jgi:DNA-binding protein HU-beta
MNKADLVDKIAGACEISKAQATTAIDTAVSSITGALKKGDRVALIGFGTFSISQRKARNGRNPQTGATIKIAARKVAKFSPGAELKKAFNTKSQRRNLIHETAGLSLPFFLHAASREQKSAATIAST